MTAKSRVFWLSTSLVVQKSGAGLLMSGPSRRFADADGCLLDRTAVDMRIQSPKMLCVSLLNVQLAHFDRGLSWFCFRLHTHNRNMKEAQEKRAGSVHSGSARPFTEEFGFDAAHFFGPTFHVPPGVREKSWTVSQETIQCLSPVDKPKPVFLVCAFHF